LMPLHTKYSHIETESQLQSKIKHLITCRTSKNTMILRQNSFSIWPTWISKNTRTWASNGEKWTCNQIVMQNHHPKWWIPVHKEKS